MAGAMRHIVDQPAPSMADAAGPAVTTEAFERELAALIAAVSDPRAGVFGPGSVTWRIDREAVLFLGAGRASLLQLAHPWVAAAIAERSRVLADPIGRFHRTFGVVFAMVFGTLDQATAAARGLHRRHAGIAGALPSAAGPLFPAGSAYRANDVAALRWVHATLTETAFAMYELALPPLDPAERDRYWAESRRYAALFGVPAAALPPDWDAFVAYNHAMWRSDALTVSPEARAVAHQLLAGAGSRLRIPAWYRALTAHILPPRLRAGFALPYGPAERRTAERAIAWTRRVYPGLPPRLRFVGPYQEASARLAGRPHPDAATRLLNRFWIGRPRLGA